MLNSRDPMLAMDDTIRMVQKSEHPSNKVAATVYGLNLASKPFVFSGANHCHNKIKAILAKTDRVQGRSGYIHAELNTLMHCPIAWQSLAITITDPPCPNCMKNLIDAGVHSIFVDSKGFKKDFYERRQHDFKLMSMKLAALAGVGVYHLDRKANLVHPLSNYPLAKKIKVPKNRFSTLDLSTNVLDFSETVKTVRAYANDAFGTKVLLHACETLPEGMSSFEEERLLDDDRLSHRYSFKNFPLLSLLIIAARKGLQIDKQALYFNYEPGVMDLVYLVSFGVKKIVLPGGKELDEAAILLKLS